MQTKKHDAPGERAVPPVPYPSTDEAGMEFYLAPSVEAIDESSHYLLWEEEKYLIAKYFRPGERILDLACGMGRTTLRMHEARLSVVGIDISEPLIEAARKRFPYLEFRSGSFTRIEEADSSVEHIFISSQAIDLVSPLSMRLTVLRECRRVLKPGGILIFSSYNLKCWHLFSPRMWSRPMIKLQHSLKAFGQFATVATGELPGLIAAPEAVIDQTIPEGFDLLEVVGQGKRRNTGFNRYLSPYFYYVFRKR